MMTSFNYSKNAVPTHSLYGNPQRDARLAGAANARLAPASAPYVGRGNKCTANEDTCEGNSVQGQTLCVGHYRSAVKKQQKAMESKEEAVDGV